MPATTDTSFLVTASEGPLILRIKGKANYLNCGSVGYFFDRTIEEGYRQYVVDFLECSGMDSTFLGLLASAGLQLREKDPPGSLVLVRLNDRNKELVQNVGLHNLMVIEDTIPNLDFQSVQPLGGDPGREKDLEANSKMVLKAHEALLEADESNKQKFQDVVTFLRSQVGD